jgi:hypothetical protein
MRAIVACVLGSLLLFTVNANGVPVFQAETAKDAAQDQHMSAINDKISTIQSERADRQKADRRCQAADEPASSRTRGIAWCATRASSTAYSLRSASYRALAW